MFSRFATASPGPTGSGVSRFVVDYLKHPEGGRQWRIKIDGRAAEMIDTRPTRPARRSRPTRSRTGRTPSSAGARPGVRAFGVWMERDTPGWCSTRIGIQGCRIRFLDKSDDAHFAEQLRARSPSLTVFHYGMNESEDGELFPLDQ